MLRHVPCVQHRTKYLIKPPRFPSTQALSSSFLPYQSQHFPIRGPNANLVQHQHRRCYSARYLRHCCRGRLGVMAPTNSIAWALKLLCLLAASVCLLPYLASPTDGTSMWSRIAPRALSVVSMTAKYAPSEGSDWCAFSDDFSTLSLL